MKKIIAFLCICILISVPVLDTIYASECYKVEKNKIIKNQQSYYTSTRFKEKYTTLRVCKERQESITKFPDNYAGMYINQENELVVNFVTDNVNLLDKNIDENIVYHRVNYSLNYLENILNYISANMTFFSIKEVYIDEYANKVVIQNGLNNNKDIENYLCEKISEFDTNAIQFMDVEGVKWTDAAGTKINSIIDKKYCRGFTMGYNAHHTNMNRPGFVTCAHSISGVSDGVYRFGTSYRLGCVAKYQLGGKIDASFVLYDHPSNITSNSLTGAPITGTYAASQITTGMIVYKYGLASQLQSGKVISTNTAFKVNNIQFTDQIKVDIIQKEGDSGAPLVFNFIGPMQEGQIYIVNLLGIVTCSNTAGTIGYASKAEYINSILGITTYLIV